jgi:hypothetical protein
VIRNAVIHLTNEQPLLADLFAVPTSADAGLLCTNVRMMDGKRPVFIDSSAATFLFPYLVVRFLEIPPGALERHAAESGDTSPALATALAGGPPAGDGPLDAVLPVAAGEATDEPGADDLDLDLDLDIDEGFLQRVRDI